MKDKLKSVLWLVCAVCVLASIPVFLSKDNPIEADVPTLTLEEVTQQEEAQQKTAQASAKKAKVRRVFRCQADEDCIIVDKDPCGCLVGPEGVTAINAEYTLDFNRMQSQALTKACPDREPSHERECSPSAEAVCQENVCKIVY